MRAVTEAAAASEPILPARPGTGSIEAMASRTSAAPASPAGAIFGRGAPASRNLFILAMLVILMIASFVADDVRRSRVAALEAGKTYMTGLNSALAKQTEISVQSIDLSVRSAIEFVTRSDAARADFGKRARTRFREVLDATPYVATLLYADELGHVRAYSHDADFVAVSLADRTHFTVHRDDDSAGLYVSAAFTPRLGDERLRIAFSRRVNGPGGRFAGIVAATMIVDEFIGNYAAVLDLASAATTFVRADGGLIARYPAGPDAYRRAYPDLPSLRHLRAGERRGTFRVSPSDSPFDARPRLVAFSAIAGGALVLATSAAEEDLLRSWRGEASRAAIFGIAGCLLIGVPFAMTFRHQRRSERQSTELALGEERLRLALAASNQGLYDIDYGTGSMAVSPEYARLLGFDPASFRESCIALVDRIHPDDLPRYEHLFEEHSSGRAGDFRCEFRQRALTGEWRWTLSTGEIVSRDATGRPQRMVGTLMDITPIKDAEVALRNLNLTLEKRVEDRTAELRRSNAELASALQGLESFAYSMSHDLRGPLRGIDGHAKLAKDLLAGMPGDEAHGYLDKVRAAAAGMNEVISNLLALSRIMRDPLHVKDVDLSAMAREIAANLGRRDPDRRVEWRIADGLGARGDTGMIRVMLDNLLENAWKFTAKSAGAAIEFGAGTAPDGQPEFFIRDNGAGFDMAYASMLFEPFRRLHGPHEFEGTGIGLATVMRVALRHGGTVRGEGAVGLGATFRFTLPNA